MISIGICEDEEKYRRFAGELLRQYFTEKGIDYKQIEYQSAVSFMEQKDSIDILILDIEMEGLSGIQLKDWLCQEDSETKVLFVSGHMEGMSEAFGKNVYGFLKKPLRKTEFEKYMNRMIEDIEDDRIITIKSINKKLLVKISSIYYFESQHKYSRMVGRYGENFCDEGLIQLEERLRSKDFYRCHKSYLVNLRNIRDVSDHIRMTNGDMIPVSRRKAKGLEEAYREYVIRKSR
ncbi:MAG: response regulator transcription factor [Lachnospiraceae bacterium]|nr:response regulator transcription factor [Lachnospiraceae bacterium]